MKNKTIAIAAISLILMIILILAGALVIFLTDFSKPETTIRKLEILGIDEDRNGFTIGVVMDIYNPNPLELEIISVEGRILIDDTPIGDIYNTTGLGVPGKNSRELRLVIHVDDAGSLIISGEELEVMGKTTARYLGKKGSSGFGESIDLRNPLEGENIPPVPIIIGPHNERPLVKITFDGSNSRDRDGDISSYSWDLGDGNTATGPVITHRYATGGIYSVKLTVKDDKGATSTASHQIIISAL